MKSCGVSNNVVTSIHDRKHGVSPQPRMTGVGGIIHNIGKGINSFTPTRQQNQTFAENKSIYRPALRDCSQVSGDIQFRKEVVSQFNYYKIISSFRKEVSPQPKFGNIVGSIISGKHSFKFSKSPLLPKRELIMKDHTPNDAHGTINGSIMRSIYPMQKKLRDENIAKSFDINLPSKSPKIRSDARRNILLSKDDEKKRMTQSKNRSSVKLVNLKNATVGENMAIPTNLNKTFGNNNSG
jgi:hypothetical protein